MEIGDYQINQCEYPNQEIPQTTTHKSRVDIYEETNPEEGTASYTVEAELVHAGQQNALQPAAFVGMEANLTVLTNAYVHDIHPRYTGSADMQIALLTEHITELKERLKHSTKDYEARLALLKLIGQRRLLLEYLNSTDTKRYQALITKLKLRR